MGRFLFYVSSEAERGRVSAVACCWVSLLCRYYCFLRFPALSSGALLPVALRLVRCPWSGGRAGASLPQRRAWTSAACAYLRRRVALLTKIPRMVPVQDTWKVREERTPLLMDLQHIWIMLTWSVMIKSHIYLSLFQCRCLFLVLMCARATCIAWIELCHPEAIIWKTFVQISKSPFPCGKTITTT